ncbi:hypothetical protein HPP92_013703 [Vanilla planifolia]|uniref:Uncharacterized protein n=1 Tax=Vanilla planifolia TaxID=51239 RepID=A0A835QUJ2_VANPL|nr:hypothetical protein HPP92_013703 [Vanilla planifolia]
MPTSKQIMEQNSRVRSLSHFHFEHSNPNSPQKNTRPGIQQGRDEGVKERKTIALNREETSNLTTFPGVLKESPSGSGRTNPRRFLPLLCSPSAHPSTFLSSSVLSSSAGRPLK